MKKSLVIIISSVLALLLAGGIGSYFYARHLNAEAEKRNVSWYSEEKTEFLITEASQLYDMAVLSRDHDFAGQTFKLGNDIVFNEGTADAFLEKMPENIWERSIYQFAGTFDGQGYAIKGVYATAYLLSPLDLFYENHPSVEYWSGKYLYLPIGLFSYTKQDAVIRNLSVTDSLFVNCSNTGCGSIVSNGAGTLENVYSNAVIYSFWQNAGGLVGLVENGSFRLENCWYDGEIILKNSGRGCMAGGLIGTVKKNARPTEILHCLNTADISNEYTAGEPRCGGFIGYMDVDSSVNLKDSLSTGNLTTVRRESVGSAIGRVYETSILNAEQTYSNLSGYPAVFGYYGGQIRNYPVGLYAECLTGDAIEAWTDLDFEEHWTIADGEPRLRAFGEGAVTAGGKAKAYDVSWYDPASDEYTLTTLEQFQGLYILSCTETFSGKTVKLGADLTVNAGKAEDFEANPPENRWYPIRQFGGTFDGQGHTIDGVYLNTNEPGSGLFASVTETGTVKNLRLENSCFLNYGNYVSFFGSVIGCLGGTADTIYSNALLAGTARRSIGGIVGDARGEATVVVTNCWFDGVIELRDGDASQAGGIVGRNESTTPVLIEHCLNTGELKGGVLMGGIIGLAVGSLVDISDTLNVGAVEGEKNVGAMTSWVADGADMTFDNAYALQGCCVNTVDNVLTSYSGACMVIDESYLTGTKAYQWTMLDFDDYWAVRENGTPILQSFAETVPDLKDVERKMDTAWYSSKEKEFVLNTVEELYGFAYLSYNTDFRRKSVSLSADFVLNEGNAATFADNAPENPWFPVNGFAGVFDGQGHTISGLYQKEASNEATGLFGKTAKGAEIRNLRLTNSYLEKEGPYVGSIAGIFSGIAEGIYSDATVRATGLDRSRIGGLFGAVDQGDITLRECWFDGKVEGNENRYVGGLIGSVDGNAKNIIVEHCMTSGSVSGRDQVAGLVGYLVYGDLVFTDVLAIGTVDTVGSTVGSLIGGRWSEKPSITIVNSAGVGNPDLSGTAAAKEVTESAKINSRSRDDLRGADGLFLNTWIDFNEHYIIRENEVPALRSLAGYSALQAAMDKFRTNYTTDANGRKTYTIRNAEDLKGFALACKLEDFKGSTVLLAADIQLNAGDASSFKTSAPAAKWIPIGSSVSPFAGTFDGMGHTISGLYYNEKSEEPAGFFGKTAAGSVVRNLRLTNSYIGKNGPYAGGIAGSFAGTAERIYSNAIVEALGNGRSRFGGLFGMVDEGGAIITECWFDGTVNASGNQYVGGLIGSLDKTALDVRIEHSLMTGTVNGKDQVGGILGYLVSGNVTFDDALMVGTYASEGQTVGTLVGGRYSATPSITIRNSAGVGNHDMAGTAAPKEVTNAAKINSRTPEDLKGADGLFLNTWIDFEQHYVVRDTEVPALRSLSGSLSNLQQALDNFKNNAATEDGKKVYSIQNADDLATFSLVSKSMDFADAIVRLTADITVNTGNSADWATAAPETAFTPIGSSGTPFAGTFDGQGHTLSGIYVNANGNAGLFAETAPGSVLKDFRIENSYVESGAGIAGTVAATFAGTAEKIYSNATLSATGGSAYFGGLFGSTDHGPATLTECWYDGTINADGKTWVGGLIGGSRDEVTVSHCLFTGTITAKNGAGGILGNTIGTAGVTFEDTLSTGTVNATQWGTLVGGRQSADSALTANNSAGVGASKWYGNSGTSYGTNATNISSRTADQLKGEDGLWLGSWVDFETYYVVRDDDVPALRSLSKELSALQQAIDGFKQSCTTDGDGKKTYTVSTADEFDVFAMLSKSTDFAGNTVKLAADITVNTGNAADWAVTAPAKNWRMIGSTGVPFAGTFDGQGHTISGIYRATAETYSGLFQKTAVTAVLKDFRLENSYFTSNVPYEGSIAGSFAGKAEKIYSNATVTATGSRSRYGGFFGNVEGATAELIECWFDGAVNASGNAYVGGLIGGLDTATDVTVSHCLFSGSISGTTEVGGIVGVAQASNSNVTFEDTLSIGSITATKWGGLISGRLTASSILTANNSASLGANKWYGNSGASYGTNAANISSRTADQLKGEDGLWLDTWLDFENYWRTRDGEVPSLRSLTLAD